jgi:hypothetical protein
MEHLVSCRVQELQLKSWRLVVAAAAVSKRVAVVVLAI